MSLFLNMARPRKMFSPTDGGGVGGNQQVTDTQTQTTHQPANATQTIDIDYNKVADAVEKRGESTLKGILKSQGLTGDQLDQAIIDFKAKQAQQTEAEIQANKAMKLELETLRQEKLNNQIEKEVITLADGLTINNEKLPFLMKMIDKEKSIKEDGSIDTEALKTEIENVTKAFPDFIEQNKDDVSKGMQVYKAGADGTKGTEAADTINALLNKAFGIKK